MAPGPTRVRPVAPHGLALCGTGGLDNTPPWAIPTRKAIVVCARADPSTQHPAGAGTFFRRARSTRGPWIGRAPTRSYPAYGKPSPTLVITHPSPASTYESPEGHPNGMGLRRWGGSTPNHWHPAALRLEMQFGSDSPEQHDNTNLFECHYSDCLAPESHFETQPKGEVVVFPSRVSGNLFRKRFAAGGRHQLAFHTAL
jgi:hypothetical protein